jgi:hypothetical protein
VTPHLSKIELESYRRRKLSPEDLLAADDHLAVCADCRGQLEADSGISDRLRFLQRSLRPVHLSDAELDVFVKGRLEDPIAREHLEACSQCRGEAEDLRAFVLGATTPAPKRLPWRAVAAIAALVIAVVGSVVVLKRPAPAPVVPIAQSGLPNALPKELQDLRDQAVLSGRVDIPPAIARMINRPAGLLRGDAIRPVLQLETPVATAALTAQPEFRWRALPTVDWYEVAVFDSHFSPVVESGHLTGATWQCTKPLDPGKEYLWQVTTSIGGRKSLSPAPPESEARFLVLSEAESRRLAALAAKYPDDHVLLGVLYARAGALEEARQIWKDPQTGKPFAGADRLIQSIEKATKP